MTFMLHITLHIKSVIDVGGVSISLGELCLLGHKIITNPLHVWDILATGVAVFLSKACIKLGQPDTQEHYPSKGEGTPTIPCSKIKLMGRKAG